ncbi:Uncharacterised protein [Bordetella pertussis]|nr:Uncharacterised protein [Bordetella pertussis]
MGNGSSHSACRRPSGRVAVASRLPLDNSTG